MPQLLSYIPSFLRMRHKVDATHQLQTRWARTKGRIITETIPEDRILALESNYRVALPEDFRDYLRLSSPVGEAMDTETVTWWSFDRIKNIPDEYPRALGPAISDGGRKYLFFADYCLWCWAWAISCADNESHGQVALIGGSAHDRIVANSFSDFVGNYLRDPGSVMWR